LIIGQPISCRNAGPRIFMKPALTTRSGRCAATALASAASQAARSANRRAAVRSGHPGALGAGEALDAGAVGGDAHHPRGYRGSAAASSSACSSVPEPDTSTTTRAGTGTSIR
jgi:hypothetical protein